MNWEVSQAGNFRLGLLNKYVRYYAYICNLLWNDICNKNVLYYVSGKHRYIIYILCKYFLGGRIEK